MQYGHGGPPEDEARQHAPPGHHGEDQAGCDQHGEQNHFTIPAQQQVRPVCGLMNRNLARSVFHGYTTAPPTPNRMLMKLVPATRNAIASTERQARRANSLSSPPNTRVPPATIRAMMEIASATGPVSETATVWSGVSQGRPPPPAPPAKAERVASATTAAVLTKRCDLSIRKPPVRDERPGSGHRHSR